MMPCTHENAYLIGTAEGIRCRRCGQVFATFADIHPAPVPEEIPEEKKRSTGTRSGNDSRKAETRAQEKRRLTI